MVGDAGRVAGKVVRRAASEVGRRIGGRAAGKMDRWATGETGGRPATGSGIPCVEFGYL